MESEQAVSLFRMIVDEEYRYHQFWGGISFDLLIYLVWISCGADNEVLEPNRIVWFAGCSILLAVTIMATIESFSRQAL
jgi:hypothetical protein